MLPEDRLEGPAESCHVGLPHGQVRVRVKDTAWVVVMLMVKAVLTLTVMEVVTLMMNTPVYLHAVPI